MTVFSFRLIGALVLSCFLVNANAVVETYQFETPTQQALYQRLVEELRCPKCQNQNLEDSNSPIAKDLRRELYRMVSEGKSEEEIKTFMVQRYGEYVLYRPRLSARTLVLWFAPAGLLAVGLIVVGIIVIRNHRREVGQSDIENDSLSSHEQQCLQGLLEQNKVERNTLGKNQDD